MQRKQYTDGKLCSTLKPHDFGRRTLFLAVLAQIQLAARPSPAQAKRTRTEYKDAVSLDPATSTELTGYEDPEFTCLVPAKWQAVPSLDRAAGILGSWYNPYEPGAETLAVYVRPVPEGVQDTMGLGMVEDWGRQAASVAPNSLLLEASEHTDASGQVYYTTCVEFDGAAAGRFGAAIEWRVTSVQRGQQYTLRITTTRYRYLAFPEVKAELASVVNSFRLLA